ncbi:oxidoreductase [Nocardioides zeae]|uniref:SDR family NAD(P)-dependent oxidoreductase n=1 Tax=Nocardioides zeae TaxID=1457234 RepID=A0A6P0HUA7_9ACTN|nr:SDR family NAD(P)-dependent oxidoreductase [Nocardioides zeae]
MSTPQPTSQPAQPVAVVTGASTGIGRAAAAALADAGHTVIGTSRRSSQARPLAGATFLDLEVASDESVRALVDAVLDRFGRIDVLVNNAGVGAIGAAEEASPDEVRDVFDVNVFGVMRMSNAVLPSMRSRGAGRIVNVSSVLGLVPAPFMATYAASKHAVEGYTESLDHEVREHGVRALLVEPAYTRTQFEQSSSAPAAPLAAYDARRATAADVVSAAMRRADEPTVVAQAIVRAATDTAPRLRYPAGPSASRTALLRRFVPAAGFDRSIRKLNRLPV